MGWKLKGLCHHPVAAAPLGCHLTSESANRQSEDKYPPCLPQRVLQRSTLTIVPLCPPLARTSKVYARAPPWFSARLQCRTHDSADPGQEGEGEPAALRDQGYRDRSLSAELQREVVLAPLPLRGDPVTLPSACAPWHICMGCKPALNAVLTAEHSWGVSGPAWQPRCMDTHLMNI